MNDNKLLINGLKIYKVTDYSLKSKKEYTYLSLVFIDKNNDEKEFKRVFLDDKELTLLDFVI